MFIKTLELNNFRNYETLYIDFSEGVNIIYGNNAQGKTNILEALYMCCTTKSQKGSKEKEMIRFGCDEAHMRMFTENNGIEHKIDMHLKKNKSKGVAIDGIPISKSAELYGMMNIISFSPDDLSIIKNGPGDRRRFIDMELCQLDKLYMYNLMSYNRALMQRNNLLKQIISNNELADTLQIWDEQLVNYGKYIIGARQVFIDEINEISKKIHRILTADNEILNIKYCPESDAENLEKNIAAGRERDIFLKMTNSGPHRDDMEFQINGEDARKFGSQGQQRTIALTLKLAEIELVKTKTGNKPVLLLDDVLSELDRNRQTQLLNSIDDIQTIITCTGLEEFVNDRIKYNRIYKVVNGNIEITEQG